MLGSRPQHAGRATDSLSLSNSMDKLHAQVERLRSELLEVRRRQQRFPEGMVYAREHSDFSTTPGSSFAVSQRLSEHSYSQLRQLHSETGDRYREPHPILAIHIEPHPSSLPRSGTGTMTPLAAPSRASAKERGSVPVGSTVVTNRTYSECASDTSFEPECDNDELGYEGNPEAMEMRLMEKLKDALGMDDDPDDGATPGDDEHALEEELLKCVEGVLKEQITCPSSQSHGNPSDSWYSAQGKSVDALIGYTRNLQHGSEERSCLSQLDMSATTTATGSDMDSFGSLNWTQLRAPSLHGELHITSNNESPGIWVTVSPKNAATESQPLGSVTDLETWEHCSGTLPLQETPLPEVGNILPPFPASRNRELVPQQKGSSPRSQLSRSTIMGSVQRTFGSAMRNVTNNVQTCPVNVGEPPIRNIPKIEYESFVSSSEDTFVERALSNVMARYLPSDLVYLQRTPPRMNERANIGRPSLDSIPRILDPVDRSTTNIWVDSSLADAQAHIEALRRLQNRQADGSALSLREGFENDASIERSLVLQIPKDFKR
ncbi:hypothetical protein BJ742DRAFT_852397 [Cladochytrium replicatum]|nr:hypothetical protein BJ742DRAFT_852397 [Cladochytrium replicatum]